MGAMSGAVPARGRRAPSSPVAVEVAGIKVEVVRKDVRNLNLRIRRMRLRFSSASGDMKA